MAESGGEDLADVRGILGEHSPEVLTAYDRIRRRRERIDRLRNIVVWVADGLVLVSCVGALVLWRAIAILPLGLALVLSISALANFANVVRYRPRPSFDNFGTNFARLQVAHLRVAGLFFALIALPLYAVASLTLGQTTLAVVLFAATFGTGFLYLLARKSRWYMPMP